MRPDTSLPPRAQSRRAAARPCTSPRLRRGTWRYVALIALTTAAPALADATQVRRFLTLLSGIEQEYREAFDGNGKIAQPFELEEAKLLAGEARSSAARLDLDANIQVQTRVAQLADAVAAHAAVGDVVTTLRKIRDSIQEATGVAEEALPSRPPSATTGKTLYVEHCASCHGMQGKGDGPDAARLERRPADFTDISFMHRETPMAFFTVISLGRRRSAMPSWQDSLSVQERWDLVSYLWSFHAAPQQSAAEPLFVTNCARCHVAAAADPQGAPTWDFARLSAQSDAEIFNTISDGKEHTPSFGGLAVEERWYLVGAVRQLTLGATTPTAAGGEYIAAALDRVAGAVQTAVDAYRLRDPEAVSLGHLAYLSFEPLEPVIAAHDAALVRHTEDEFARLQRTLAQPDASREVEAAARAVTRALSSAKQTTHSPPAATSSTAGRVAAVALILLSIVGLAVFVRRVLIPQRTRP